MQATEKQVQMAAQLYDMRDKARRLLGEKYARHMAELGKILRVTADRDGKSAPAVATEVCKRRGLIGMDLLLTTSCSLWYSPTQHDTQTGSGHVAGDQAVVLPGQAPRTAR